ncbi:adenylate/guanylate cyclase domain-containing protein [Mesorhizobium hawassense]|uniref:Adenylate/guanylate cyclase domain-containing protein n=1 Tax=Mesorhizobium hawassense TaxID=1209954 RepID=A0A330HIN4_9HYPH|nr:adenylate/guanylate cyclase domain-containing protein [Mesorhizobium hawassense]RAZ88571.1 adenylate/guanylate cyclase domain-containing protein [Mesorhizobium hawassense]
MSETRKIAAILVSDVVGYSRLAGADEDRILARLRALRSDLIDPTIAVHHGRVVKRTGDGALVEFRSVVDAVRCAIEVQNGMVERNAGLPPDRRIDFRIGIHLGDVVEERDGDLMGDGVNIAARLEGICEPGSICLSEQAYWQVKARLDLAINDRGAVQLKNIADPVRVYSLQVGVPAQAKPAAAAEAAVPERPSPQLALPDKPSIAVLAFQNMSGDPDQEYFADGITEDVITDLSKVSGLLVIARNSSFAYKGKAVDVRQVARELGVRSVLEGSIRRAGNRVRITAQLIDAETGGHLWADRFDRELSDVFAVQDEVTRRIVDALMIELSPSEAAMLGAVKTTSKAHDFFLLGREALWGTIRNRGVFERSTDLFAQAIAQDSNYGEPYAGLAMAEVLNWQFHWTDGWSESLEKAERHVDLALQKSPQVAFVHYVASVFYLWNKDLDRSAAEADAALNLNPNYAQAHNSRGIVNIYGGQPLAAIPHIEQAIRLDPALRQLYIHFLGSAYLVAGKFEAASALFRERIRLAPNTDLSRAFLAVALGHLGEAEEAGRVWRELMEINPKYSFAEHVGRLPFRDQADVDHLSEGLSKVGLPS